VLCDTELDQMEDGLVELLANRITAKFIQLEKEREQMLVGSMSSSLMSLTHTLLFSENNEELYRSILEIGADLVGASRVRSCWWTRTEKISRSASARA
jgi:hypothetical protein